MIRNALGMVGMVAGVAYVYFCQDHVNGFDIQGCFCTGAACFRLRLSDVLNIVASSLTNMFAAVAVVGLAFFLGLLIMIGIGNMTIMVVKQVFELVTEWMKNLIVLFLHYF